MQMDRVFSHEGLERAGKVVVASLKHFVKDNGPQWAAAIAYYSLLSLFPLLLAAIAIAAYFVDREEINQLYRRSTTENRNERKGESEKRKKD